MVPFDLAQHFFIIRRMVSPIDHIASTLDKNKKRTLVIVTLMLALCLVALFSIDNEGPLSQVIVDYPRTLHTSHSDRKPCTMTDIQTYISQNNFFPHKGRWIMENKKPLRWSPDLCTFQNTTQTIDVDQCLRNKSIEHVLVLGDSNGLRFFYALNRFFKDCKMLKQEGGPPRQPDVTYFSTNNNVSKSDLRFQEMDCSGCKSQQKKCCLSHNRSVIIEYVVMEFTLDTQVTTYRNPCLGQCFHSNTRQQFIFGEYLAGSYPDLILLFSNAHDRIRKHKAVIKAELTYLIQLIRASVPEKSKVVWFSHQAEDESKKPERWQNITYDGIYKSTEHIELLNRELFISLKPEFLNPNSRIDGFFDLLSIANKIERLWSEDGFHFRPPWYNMVMHYFLQAYCESN